MLRKIKSKFQSEEKKRVLSNFFSLSILQGASYILPLITLPYLVRTLEPEKFGLVMFAQAFIQYFVVLTDYGFNLSATRKISIHRDNPAKISEIFSTVMTLKLILLMVSFLILSIMVFSFEKFSQDWEIYYLTFGIVLGQVLFPVWFFQGMETMKYITYLNITAKLIFTVFIFIFIHDVSDYLYVPLINSLGFIVAGAIGLSLAMKKLPRLVMVDFKTLQYSFQESTSLFVSNISSILYTSTNTFLLGIFTNNYYVGIYSSIEKIIIALKSLLFPIFQALYPFLARKKSEDIKRIISILALISGTIFFTFSVLIYLFATQILTVLYHNEKLLEYTYILQIMSPIVFIAAIGMTYSYLYFLAMKMDTERMKLLLYAGLFNIIIIPPLIYFYNIKGLALGTVTVELLMVFLSYYYYRKKNVNKD